jgi:hypothetical protein
MHVCTDVEQDTVWRLGEIGPDRNFCKDGISTRSLKIQEDIRLLAVPLITNMASSLPVNLAILCSNAIVASSSR